jgi:UDP-4-amino-4,6-dideoxy-N-acetyl-beta-L-altrosamine N-acetyltransferase
MINTGHDITLAPVLQKQLGQMITWRNDRRIWKWCRQNSVISEAHHMAWFNSLATRKDVRMFSIIDKEGAFVGVCGLTDIDHINSRAEFSLYIDPDLHGKGLGKAALMTLIDHAFNDLNLNCVWGESFAGNPAMRMFESLGMKKEGVRRAFYFRDGEYIDCTLYSILRGEQAWNGQHLV